MKQISTDEGFELLAQLERLKHFGVTLRRPAHGEAYHDGSVIVVLSGNVIGEAGSFSGAVSYANGYLKALDATRWQPAPVVE